MSEPGHSAKHAPKARNPVERILVWGGIVIMLGVVIVEYRAKQAYDTSVKGLEELSNGMRDVTVDEARQKMVGYSTSEGPLKVDGLDGYSYTWFSLFKGGTYRITLIADSDGQTLKTFTGPAFAEDPDEVAARIEAANADNPDAPPPFVGAAAPEPGEASPETSSPQAADSSPPAPEKEETGQAPGSE